MALKRVFISFDWHHNRDYRYLLAALYKNPTNDIKFVDFHPGMRSTPTL